MLGTVIRSITTLLLVCSLCACGGGGGGGGGGVDSGGSDPLPVVNPGQPPTANAGMAATYNGGEIALLDGTASTDADSDPLRYTWTQTGGSNTVRLDNSHAARPVFEVPNADDVLTFSLVANDGYEDSTASAVTITTIVYSGGKTPALSQSPFRGSYDFSGAGQDLIVANGNIYLPAGINGLLVLDASDPVALAESGSMTSESAHDVTLIGDYVYHTSYDSVFDRARIWATDVSTPATPAWYSMPAMFDSPASARLTSVGNVLYAAGGDDATTPSLRVYELSDPADPLTLLFKTSLVLPAVAEDVEVAGNYAYVADSASGLRIIDVSNATHATPTLSETGSYDTAGNALNVAVSGSYAYLADAMNGLVILNVSDPASPSLVNTIPVPGGTIYGTVAVDVAGSTLYLATDFDVFVYDVSNPASPALLGQYRAGNLIRKVRADGSYLYVTDSQGIRTIPIDTVSLPRGTALYTASADIRKMVLSGDLGFVQMDRRVDILDLRNTALPTLLGSYSSPEHIYDMTVIGTFVYLAQGDKISLLLFRDPTSPSLATPVAAGSGIHKIVHDDAYAYVYRNTFPNADIVIYDLSDPAAPIPKGTIASPHNDANWLRSMAIKGDRLYLTELNTNGTFRVADVSNPVAPALIAGGLSSVDLYGMAVRNDYVLSINNNTGVKVIDVSAPATPAFVGTGYAQDGYTLSVAGNRVYANSDFVGGGVKVLDVEDPLTISLSGELAPAGGADHPLVKGEALFSLFDDLDLYRHEREPRLATRYIAQASNSNLQYSVSWDDDSHGDDHDVLCWVTAGACGVNTIDQASNTATITWTLPGSSADHELTIAVGNGHYFGITKERVRVE